jgi:hypothetical protein
MAVGDRVIVAAVDGVHLAVGGVDVDAAARRALPANALVDHRGATARLGVCLGQGGEAVELAATETYRPRRTCRSGCLQKAAPGYLRFQDIHPTSSSLLSNAPAEPKLES